VPEDQSESDQFDAYRPERPDVLTWLQGWYAAHADGDWEHQHGVRIDTLDNPGWSVVIDLTATEFERRSFDRVELHRSEDDWVVAWVENASWHLACGPLNLAEGLHRFRVWAGDTPTR
jgi:hypothetical protein